MPKKIAKPAKSTRVAKAPVRKTAKATLARRKAAGTKAAKPKAEAAPIARTPGIFHGSGRTIDPSDLKDGEDAPDPDRDHEDGKDNEDSDDEEGGDSEDAAAEARIGQTIRAHLEVLHMHDPEMAIRTLEAIVPVLSDLAELAKDLEALGSKDLARDVRLAVDRADRLRPPTTRAPQ